jgi:hypothetical protein
VKSSALAAIIHDVRSCPICNKAEPPRLPSGFKIDSDENGRRH